MKDKKHHCWDYLPKPKYRDLGRVACCRKCNRLWFGVMSEGLEIRTRWPMWTQVNKDK